MQIHTTYVVHSTQHTVIAIRKSIVNGKEDKWWRWRKKHDQLKPLKWWLLLLPLLILLFLAFLVLWLLDMLLFCVSDGMKQHIFILNSKRIYVPSSSTIILFQFKSFVIAILRAFWNYSRISYLFFFSSFNHANFILWVESCEYSNLYFELFYN